MSQVTSTAQWGAQAAGTGGASCQTTKPRAGAHDMAAQQMQSMHESTQQSIITELIRAREIGQREGKEDASHEVKQLQGYLGDWQRQAVALDAKCKELNREVTKEVGLHINTAVELYNTKAALSKARKEGITFRVVRRIPSRLRLGADTVEAVPFKSIVPEGLGYLITI